MNRTLAFTSKNAALREYAHRHLIAHYHPLVGVNKLSASVRPYSDAGPKLPRQPVPSLQDTLERYVKSCMPFLSKAEYDTTKRLAVELTIPGGCGDQLQKYLEDRAKNTENWLADWWLNIAYLEYRNPVVVWSSPGQTMPKQTFKNNDDRLVYTAKVILAALDYKQLIDENKIPTDKMGKDMLDMQQYKKIFGTNRVPAIPRDCLQYNPESRHIIIAYKNNFFKVNVIGDDCRASTPDENQMLTILEDIVNNTKTKGPPVGILTGNHRDSWANARDVLLKNEMNRESICNIEHALFLVCLDEPIDGSRDAMTRTGEQLIHGGGVCFNSGNRWFDKTVQFIVSTDGLNGLSYEHSPAEGVPIAVMVDYIVNNIKKSKVRKGTECVPIPEQLCFCINKEAQDNIDEAVENMDVIVRDLELCCFKFDCYGSDFIKSAKFSPDSFFQIAIQFAFYRLHCTPGAHYESAATRKFVHGRTETIRSCSVESVCFARSMLNKDKPDDYRLNLLRKAIDGHKEYATAAVNGKGVDRHMLGLRLAAKALNVELPTLFTDPAYQRSTHMRLSTSQVATKCDAFMCYGPLVENGYGCCYNIRPDDINVGVSSFRCDKETDSVKFREALELSLIDMRDLLVRMEKSKL